MNKSYNNNEQSDLLKDLKNLPKIKAPDYFEYNLMTKIQNKNFGPTVEEELHFNWVKFLAPSALIISLALLFFIFYPQQNKEINSVVSIPQKIETPSVVSNSTIADKKLDDRNLAENHKTVKKEDTAPQIANPSKPSLDSQDNIPLSNRKPILLDEYISGHNTQKGNLRQGNIVREGRESSNLPGLIESKKLNQKTLKKYRAIVDSIKRADSLKKALK